VVVVKVVIVVVVVVVKINYCLFISLNIILVSF
jgi:hypothetical protein